MAQVLAITCDGAGNILSQAAIAVPDEVTNVDVLRDKARQALVTNAAFLALGTPTNAQVLTQVQRLTRECSGLIRLLLGSLTDVSDT